MRSIYCLHANASVISNKLYLVTADDLAGTFPDNAIVAKSWFQLPIIKGIFL